MKTIERVRREKWLIEIMIELNCITFVRRAFNTLTQRHIHFFRHILCPCSVQRYYLCSVMTSSVDYASTIGIASVLRAKYTYKKYIDE